MKSKGVRQIKKIALYARVSTNNQNPETQLNDLRGFVENRGLSIYEEYVDTGISGTQESRPALNKLMDAARKRKFDAVVVWRFDRFARSTRHLVDALYEFRNLGIDFISYQENIDTSSPMGEAIFTIISAMAKLERDIISERVKAGLRQAKKAGKRIGRPPLDVDTEKIKNLRQEGLSYREIANEIGISKTSVYRILKNK